MRGRCTARYGNCRDVPLTNACLIAIVVGSAPLAFSQTPPAARHWTAYSRTASDITGDITLSSTQIVFQNGVSFMLSPVAGNTDINLETYGLTGPVHLFRVDDPRAVHLLNGNTLCGAMAHPVQATFIGTVAVGEKELGVAVFSGRRDLTVSNVEARLCGTYRYFAD